MDAQHGRAGPALPNLLADLLDVMRVIGGWRLHKSDLKV
jgi:hypothetical protein